MKRFTCKTLSIIVLDSGYTKNCLWQNMDDMLFGNITYRCKKCENKTQQYSF